MKRLALALALAATSAFAAAQTYNIDPMHTATYFSYRHLGFSTQENRFDKVSGKIVFDREARSGSADIVIDAKSINTGSPQFNQRLQEADFFDTANYPTISFKSTKVEFRDGKPVAIEGELTVKGVTRPVTLEVTSFEAKLHPMLNKDALGANATTMIRRSDFAMGKYVPLVSNEVTLSIAVEAIESAGN